MKPSKHKEELFPAHYLRECFNYNPVTGYLFWSSTRPEHHFKNKRAYLLWKRKCSGKEVGYRNRSGYLSTNLKQSNKQYSLLVHRIIFTIMTGSYPKGTVDHINGKREDNRWVNLQDIPFRDNVQKAKGVTGVEKIKKVCRLLERPEISFNVIAKDVGIDRSVVSSIYKGLTWKDISCNYSFAFRRNIVRGKKIKKEHLKLILLSKESSPCVAESIGFHAVTVQKYRRLYNYPLSSQEVQEIVENIV